MKRKADISIDALRIKSILLSSDSDSDSDSDLDRAIETYTKREYGNCSIEERDELYVKFNKDNIVLDDLIEWGALYHSEERLMCGNINLKTLWRLQKPLKKLNNMVGMQVLKKNIIGQILYFLQNLNLHDDMMHTTIEGPPGVGKTELGKILGEIYIMMDILKNDDIDHDNFDINKYFKIVKRSDLIGKYLGHTAALTQECIDNCKGGVMFIDEAYSLGNEEKRDSFSKECIDTINRNLTEQKSNFLCIVAGYTNDLESCFFAYNAGLKRRFPFRYTIDKYDSNELADIFKLKAYSLNWSINCLSELYAFFKENMEDFPHFGGDVETLILNCKIQHGIRVFGKNMKIKKEFSIEDIKNGFDVFSKNKNKKKIKEINISDNMMYI